MRKEGVRAVLGIAMMAGSVSLPAIAQRGTEGGEWPHYAGDSGSTKYSPLDQINRDNFAELEIAWRWASIDSLLEETTDIRPFHFRGTPLMIDGVVFMPTGMAQVAALDPATGEMLWRYDSRDYELDGRGFVQVRGIEYWTDGDAENPTERLILATRARQLISVDTKTGKPDPDFGIGGVVDLNAGLPEGRVNRNISHTAPVVVVNDTIVVGMAIFDFPLRNTSPPGHIRGFDIRTGALKWTFHSIPQEGEPYNDTWENDSWKTMGNTNVWGLMSADPELGYVYLPFGTATNDYYGGGRLGDNLYSESIVCLDASTGERVWHFQAVHHGIWDYDLVSAPNLVDIVVEGREIKAVAVVSKQGMTYVFDRATGEPVWPIVEAPVNYHSQVPGERLSKTQPFPVRPPPFETLGVDYDDLIDFTPELRAEALEILQDWVIGPLYTPHVIHGQDGKQGFIQAPGSGGGANWPGASVDPETGFLYVPSLTRPAAHSVIAPDPARSDFRFINKRLGMPNVQGLPLLKPPYRRITAFDLNDGAIVWQEPLGEGPRNHAAIEHLNLGRLGTPPQEGIVAEGGVLVTKTLLVTIEPIVDELGDRSANGSYLDAYDKATGELIAQIKSDVTLHSSPMTYLHEGRQYILVAGGGETPGPGVPIEEAVSAGPGGSDRRTPATARKSWLLAFALPEAR